MYICEACGTDISIRALREEGDNGKVGATTISSLFLSTPSARRATDWRSSSLRRELFLSTPSARRATKRARHDRRLGIISIHALREEGDLRRQHGARRSRISIHALREEGDTAGEAMPLHLQISIHALREEGDAHGDIRASVAAIFLSTPSARRATAVACFLTMCESYFYPRPPRGGRQVTT